MRPTTHRLLHAGVSVDVAEARRLTAPGNWTPDGAREVVVVALRYGTSIPRSALTLAEAMGVEEGDFGLSPASNAPTGRSRPERDGLWPRGEGWGEGHPDRF